VVLLLERAFVSWLLAMDERGGHEDLRGSDRRSVITYAHGRIGVVLLKLALPEPALSSADLFSTPVKRRLPGPFIPQGPVVTMRPEARQVVPR
jgi:hypothetical protein